jgi:ComF family protein
MLLAARCPICRRPDGAPCRECIELFAPLGPVPPPPALHALHAAIAYEDAARPLITSLKYRNQRGVVSWLADAMVAVLPRDERPGVVTWAPTSPRRRRERGFDQSELLARAVARRLRSPVRPLLRRPRTAGHQTGRDAAARRAEVAAFRLRPGVGRSVLLVDDVVTTGATLDAAANALRDGGALRIVGLVGAATPPPTRPPAGSVRGDDR